MYYKNVLRKEYCAIEAGLSYLNKQLHIKLSQAVHEERLPQL